MMLSDDKVSHLSHVILEGLKQQGLVQVKAEEGKVRKEIKRVLYDQLKVGEELDAQARKKIQSLSRKVAEGSPEWEILYRKYYEEEEAKKGRL